jgi:hypothetical protein
MWRVQSSMKHRGVGAVIVVGARESRVQGEGPQGVDVRWTNSRRSLGEVRVLPVKLAASMKEEPMTACAGSRQSLESPLQGNLHGGFGGGGEETRFGRASCPYLTERDREIHRFLEEHPEWTNEVRWQVLPGEQQPAALMTTRAMEAFIWWAYEQGAIEYPTRIPHVLAHMRAVQAEGEAHQAGRCNPVTCHVCQGRQGRLE